ncbi:transposase [Pseudomonas asiatica]|uniref:transposase n=1 Tax=Pseudomonas asiatica TaxID=2219225 RepID=UPI0038781CD2
MDTAEFSLTGDLAPGMKLNKAKVLKRGKFGQLVTFFASRKNNCSVACETLLEADFCFYLERWPGISAYCSQPFSLQLIDEDISYTPDFLARRIDGTPILFEVKSASGAQCASWEQRRSVLEYAFGIRHIAYEVIGESDVRSGAELDNLRYLYFVGFDGDSEGDRHVEALLSTRPNRRSSIAEMIRSGVSEQAIAHALFHDAIHTDLSLIINLESLIWSNP